MIGYLRRFEREPRSTVIIFDYDQVQRIGQPLGVARMLPGLIRVEGRLLRREPDPCSLDVDGL